MKRTVTITCTQDLSDSEWFRDKFIDALYEYADAVEMGAAGNGDDERYNAANGVELRVQHVKETEHVE
jgi:hypothetical protein